MKIDKDLKIVVIMILAILLILIFITPTKDNYAQDQIVYEKGLKVGQLSIIKNQVETGNILVIQNNSILSYPISAFCGGNKTS